MRIADVEEDIDHELVSKEQIDAKIHEMAALASEDYRDKNPLLVAVLKGAVNTLVAFTEAMSIPVQIDFMSLSSYGSGTVSSGEVTVRQDLSADVRGRHILIVEDIVDSGRTLAWLVAELKRRGAASVEVFALLSKPSRREVDVDVKYAGYEIPDEFVVGVDAQRPGPCALGRAFAVGQLAQAGQPVEGFGDFFFLETGCGKFAGQLHGFRARVGVNVVLEEVHEDIEHGAWA